jgi:hypothetical protein
MSRTLLSATVSTLILASNGQFNHLTVGADDVLHANPECGNLTAVNKDGTCKWTFD